MTFNKFLKGTAIAGVFAALIIPFVIPSDMFFPFITGKGFLFRSIVEVMTAAWLLWAIRDVEARPRKSYLLWAFAAFMVVIGLADLFGQVPWKSFWSNFERMEGYVSLIHIFLYFLVASCVLSTQKAWKWLLESSVWASLAMSFYCFMQLAGKIVINQGGVRVDGTFGNATYLAIYMVFSIFFALIVIFGDSKLWKKWAFSAIALCDLIILYYTATRGSILGLLGGLFLAGLIIAIWDKAEKRRRIVAASVVGAVAVIILGFFAVKNTSFVQHSPVLDRFATISWSDTSGDARTYIWPMAIKGWEEHPILGWGQENFNYIFNSHYDPAMYSQEQWFDHAHNVVLDWLDDGGILGLLAYLSLFGAALWLLWKKAHGLTFTEKALLTGLGAAYFFHNLFVFDNIVSYILFMTVLAYIQFASTRLEKPIVEATEAAEDGDGRMAGPVILIVLIFCLYFFNWRGFATNIDLIGALRNLDGGNAAGALTYFQKAVSYDTLGRAEVVERLVEAVPNMNAAGVSNDVRQQFAELAKAAVDEQVIAYPNDARYETFAGMFYEDYGQNAEAEQHFLNAEKLSPNKQSIIEQLGSFYVSAKEYDKAVPVFKQAYDLDHTDQQAGEEYAVALVYDNQLPAAKQFMSTLGYGSMTDDLFVQAYAAIGDWTDTIAVLKARVEANPKDMSALQNLAAAYYQEGNKAEAISIIQGMIAIDPTFKDQGDQYIQEMQQGK